MPKPWNAQPGRLSFPSLQGGERVEPKPMTEMAPGTLGPSTPGAPPERGRSWLWRYLNDDVDIELEPASAGEVLALLDACGGLGNTSRRPGYERRQRAKRLVLHWWGLMQWTAGRIDG